MQKLFIDLSQTLHEVVGAVPGKMIFGVICQGLLSQRKRNNVTDLGTHSISSMSNAAKLDILESCFR